MGILLFFILLWQGIKRRPWWWPAVAVGIVLPIMVAIANRSSAELGLGPTNFVPRAIAYILCAYLGYGLGRLIARRRARLQALADAQPIAPPWFVDKADRDL